MTTEPGKQTIVIHILPNISLVKGKETMILGRLIEYIKKKYLFYKNHAENETGRLASDLFLFFKKAYLYEVKVSDLQLSSNIFR